MPSYVFICDQYAIKAFGEAFEAFKIISRIIMENSCINVNKKLSTLKAKNSKNLGINFKNESVYGFFVYLKKVFYYESLNIFLIIINVLVKEILYEINLIIYFQIYL